MTQLQRIKAAQEECMDSWFYLYAMEVAELEGSPKYPPFRSTT